MARQSSHPPVQLSIYCAVAAGAALGGLARASLGLASLHLFGGPPLLGTLAANVLGSALIGVYAGYRANTAGIRPPPWLNAFVATGFCGGFTTFSLFSLELLTLLQEEAYWMALAYLIATMVLCIAVTAAAWNGARRLANRPG